VDRKVDRSSRQHPVDFVREVRGAADRSIPVAAGIDRDRLEPDVREAAREATHDRVGLGERETTSPRSDP
jgi:hypothetical protein